MFPYTQVMAQFLTSRSSLETDYKNTQSTNCTEKSSVADCGKRNMATPGASLAGGITLATELPHHLVFIGLWPLT